MKKAFVVAGGSRGLGRVITEEALAQGFPLALLGRNKADLETARNELQSKTHKVSIHTVDLTDPKTVNQVFMDVMKEHGGIEVLVNCAATWVARKPAETLEVADMKKALDLNFFATFNPTQEVLKSWKSKGGPLAIINIGATASVRGGIQTSPFCVGKAAIRSYTQSLAKELGPQGVHLAHVIVDGLIDNQRTRELNPKMANDNYMNPVSIAKTVLHIVSQDKSCWTFELDMRPFNEKW